MGKILKTLAAIYLATASLLPANTTTKTIESKLVETPTIILSTNYFSKPIITKETREPSTLEEILVEKELYRRTEKEKYIPTEEEITEVSKIVYAEAADQSPTARKTIAKMILNRKESPNYPNTINEVIYQRNAFSCINDNVNKNWKQANKEIPMNDYEKMIFERIQEEVKYVLSGGKINIPQEENIISQLDWSRLKPKDNYWNTLEKAYTNGKLSFYAPKEEVEKFKNETPITNYINNHPEITHKLAPKEIITISYEPRQEENNHSKETYTTPRQETTRKGLRLYREGAPDEENHYIPNAVKDHIVYNPSKSLLSRAEEIRKAA